MSYYLRFRDSDDAYEYFRQREVDEMTPRNAAGISPEELSLQDAFMEGQRAGARGDAAGLNPNTDPHSPEYQAWERGRSAADAARISSRRAA